MPSKKGNKINHPGRKANKTAAPNKSFECAYFERKHVEICLCMAFPCASVSGDKKAAMT